MRGNIERRGNGYRVRVSAGFDPVTGRRIQLTSLVHGSKRDADEELTKLLRLVDTGRRRQPSGRRTVAEFIDEEVIPDLNTGISERTGRRFSDRYRERCLWSMEKYIRPYLGAYKLQALNLTIMKRVRGRLLTETSLTPNTVADILSIFRTRVLKPARTLGEIADDPMEDLALPFREPTRDQIAVTPEIGRAALAAARGTTHDVGAHLALGASLRREEVLGLRRQDVDLDGGTLRIRQTLTHFAPAKEDGKRTLVPMFGPPKTRASGRVVDLPVFVVVRLRAHFSEQNVRRLALGSQWRGGDVAAEWLVVEKGDGSPWHPSSYSRGWRRIADEAGLGGLTFHGLRHGYATLLLVAGEDIKVVSDMMGHTTTSFTQDVYQSVVDD
jgi:integrase